MTVIAWDGKNLAADKRMNSGTGNPLTTITKIRRLASGGLVGWCGGISFCEAIVQWIEAGADPTAIEEKWFEHEELAGQVVFIAPGGLIMLYEHAFPITIENKIYALGSGGAYAIAAMHLGQDAVEAVKIACIYDSGCGNGIDVLTLED
jgi:ATP-dependent protease HslVU (ClpYQ) peptidase subunit